MHQRGGVRRRKRRPEVFDIGIPQRDTFWLNVTNIILGILTLGCCVAAVCVVAREILLRITHRHSPAAPPPLLH